ncbi:antiterminator LoaP [Paenibacillus sp. UMB4589-SE434]|uniref:antiterminator LoaP n=1 Tax=Paenibacillus sp. UMB4589-SE434 TaxID=3046314 RepID=UPI00254CD18C|nr:antiterminator LoaP [Paenibacillus sp. UMB4589-SE434]
MILLHWYALFVETGQEETVQRSLKQQFDPTILMSLVPKRKVPEKKMGHTQHVLRKMFPGYVLIQTSMNADRYHSLRRIPHVLRMLTNGRKNEHNPESFQLSSIHDVEIAHLLKLLDATEILEYSTLQILSNSNIHVVAGPLQGMENLIKKVDRHKNRATLQLPFLGEPRSIEVGIHIMYPPQTSE